jgi:SAM-dependent methyltransferase
MSTETEPRLMRRETLHQVLQVLREALAGGDRAPTLRVLDPDLGRGRFAGELVERGGETFVHRPWRVWLGLAERLGLRLLTPRVVGDTGLVDLRFERLGGDGDAPSAGEAPGDATERYGAAAPFARISRAEDPGVLVDLDDALDRIPLPAAPRILDLGCNTGELLALLVALRPALAAAELVGVDHSASALAAAAERLPRGRWLQADLAAALPRELGRFDLVVAWATLQSGALDDRALLRAVVQDHLAPDGSVLLGVPNCRYLDGETLHGARMKNFRQPELGLLFKDVAFYRKYLQQHRRRVFVTGRDYILVTGVPSPSSDPPAAA